MKKIAAFLTVCIVFSFLCIVAGAVTLKHNTIFRISTADPWVISGAAGEHPNYFNWYYQTKTGNTRVAVIPTKDIRNYYDGTNGYSTNEHIHYDVAGYIDPITGETTTDPTVFKLFGEGATINGTWSPEIHYFSEEDFPGMSGWYMFVALRQDYDDPTGVSSRIRMVVLKSTGTTAGKDYGHPITGEKNYSQAFLDKDGNILDEWACGQTILRIKEGKYAGIYAMWVSEHGRGAEGFSQSISIAKLKSPWQIDGEIGTVTTPTQNWEMSGKWDSENKKWLPNVVEGATPVYGKNGEIFIIYCGSGYWPGGNYALGQLTWTGGDPLLEESWEKLGTDKNPIFDAKRDTNNLDGAGHASFIQDKDGNGFAIYHAYRLDATTGKAILNSKGEKERYSFIEPYYIDYNTGIVHIGLDDDRSPADFRTATVSFNQDTSLAYLTAPTISAEGDIAIEISLSETNGNADGYAIYRSTDGKVFDHLTTVDSASYTDVDIERGKTYYYRAYAYREEEISPVSETVSVKTKSLPPKPLLSTQSNADGILLGAYTTSAHNGIRFYRSSNGTTFTMIHDSATAVPAGTSVKFTDTDVVLGQTYYYYAVSYDADYEISERSNNATAAYSFVPAPTVTSFKSNCFSLTLTFSADTDYTAYSVYRVIKETGVPSFLAKVTEATYTDTTLSPNTEYMYYVFGHIGTYSSKKSADFTAPVILGAHSYEVIEEEIPATEEAEGKTAVEKCSVCGDTRGGEVIPQLNPGSGDVNGDGKVTLRDALLAFKTGGSEADINGDGTLTFYDILLLIKMILNG